MKKIICAAVALAARLGRHAGGHDLPGAEGMQAASVPPIATYLQGDWTDPHMEPLKAQSSWLRVNFGRAF